MKVFANIAPSSTLGPYIPPLLFITFSLKVLGTFCSFAINSTSRDLCFTVHTHKFHQKCFPQFSSINIGVAILYPLVQ